MKKDKELILQCWFQASNEVMYWNTLAIDKVSDFSKQLIALASILIPIVGGVAFLHPRPNITVIVFIFLALSFLIISDVFGFVQMIISSSHFNKYVKLNAKRAKLYANNLNKALDVLIETDENYDKPDKLSKVCLYIQSSFLGAALLSIIGIIFVYLY